jgi:hypothetical protein
MTGPLRVVRAAGNKTQSVNQSITDGLTDAAALDAEAGSGAIRT